MKTLVLCVLLMVTVLSSRAQLGVNYDAAIQPTENLQYFKPKGTNLFVGDCIPFFHNGTFYNYWLLDSAHHKSLNGLGGHQWVLSTSKDLRHWKQFPIVLGIDQPWEKSICTGSVVFYKDLFYVFYATRLIENGKVNEQLSYAVSKDGIHFTKQKPNPFYTSAPGYSHRNFRDPKVFVDAAGEFHLFVSSEQQSPLVAPAAAGCLVHLSSRDLKRWTVHEPVLTGQGSVPECPDYFLWKGWYYLVYSDNSNTFYVKSRNPYGPWEEPRFQALDEDWANVVKTAGFTNDRLIAAAWIPSRLDDTDTGHEIFGGNLVFREVLQDADGDLTTKFAPELIPSALPQASLSLVPDSLGTVKRSNADFTLTSLNGLASAHYDNVPLNSRITFEVTPIGPNEELGVYLRSGEHAQGGYRLNFSANNQTVTLGSTTIQAVGGLNHPFTVDIIMTGSIIDVSIGNRRCIVNRTSGQAGTKVWFYVKHGKTSFSSVKTSPLDDK